MDFSLLSYTSDAIQIVVLTYIFVRVLRIMDTSERMVPMVFFMFATAITLINDLYWVAYVWMRRESLYVFSAIDVSSAGMDLLFPLILTTALPRTTGRHHRSLGISFVFTAGNAFLWCLWGGEWFKNIVGALPFWYLVNGCVHALGQTKALKNHGGAQFGVACLIIALANAGDYLNLWNQSRIFDTIVSLTWIACLVGLFVRMNQHIRKPADADAALACGVTGVMLSLCAMYNSFEPYYSVSSLIFTAYMICVYVLLMRRVRQA